MDKYDRAFARHNYKAERKKKYARMCQVTFAAGFLAGYLVCFLMIAQFIAK